MIKNTKIWEQFEIEFLRKQEVDYKKELYMFAKKLDKPRLYPLEDIEIVRQAVLIFGEPVLKNLSIKKEINL